MGSANRTENTDKRRHVHRKYEAAIEWSYFDQEIYYEAKLLNFSEGGVYIETGHDLKPGATIFLKMEMVSSSNIQFLDHERPRSVSLGEVKWRIDLS
jgi:hypothetical protein